MFFSVCIYIYSSYVLCDCTAWELSITAFVCCDAIGWDWRENTSVCFTGLHASGGLAGFDGIVDLVGNAGFAAGLVEGVDLTDGSDGSPGLGRVAGFGGHLGLGGMCFDGFTTIGGFAVFNGGCFEADAGSGSVGECRTRDGGGFGFCGGR